MCKDGAELMVGNCGGAGGGAAGFVCACMTAHQSAGANSHRRPNCKVVGILTLDGKLSRLIGDLQQLLDSPTVDHLPGHHSSFIPSAAIITKAPSAALYSRCFQ